jgi:putative lipase involved disintegration of autophagic bodies
MSDLLSDMQIMMGVNSIDPRVSQSRWIYDQVKALFDTYQIWVCGHSLGGTPAYIVAKHRLPDQCVVFNP